MKAIEYKAKDGYVWVRKDTKNWVLGNVIYLPPNDNIENYEEIEKPKDYDLRGKRDD